MLLAPFAIRKLGKRVVLISTNVLNIVFIGLMYPVVRTIDMTGKSTSVLDTWMPIILLVVCFWMNNLMNAFMQILTPSVNADIRDYQQYRTGERIDGMFSAVSTIGSVIALVTSSVLPVIYERGGINKETAAGVTSNPAGFDRSVGGGQTVGTEFRGQIG